MRRYITLGIAGVATAALAACGRGSESSATAGSGPAATMAESTSTGGVTASTSGGEVVGGETATPSTLGAPSATPGFPTVAIPGNNIPSPGSTFGSTPGVTPPPAMTGVPTSPIVDMNGSTATSGTIPAPQPTTPVVPSTPASPTVPSTPRGLVPPNGRTTVGTPGSVTPGAGATTPGAAVPGATPTGTVRPS